MARNMNNLISNTMGLRVNEFPSRTHAVGFHYETYGEINHLALTLSERPETYATSRGGLAS